MSKSVPHIPSWSSDFFIKPVKMKMLLKAANDAFEKITRWGVEKYDLV